MLSKRTKFYLKLFWYKFFLGYTIVYRHAAIGDTFLFIPVAKAIKEKKGIKKIFFLSSITINFMNKNPFIDKVKSIDKKYSCCPFIDINLDNVSELDGHSHIVDAYAKKFEVTVDDYIPCYSPKIDHVNPTIEQLKNSIVIDLGDTWSNRQLSVVKLQKIVDYYASKYTVCTIGNGKRSLYNCIDMTNKTSEEELFYILKNSKVVLSQDSFILHLAEAANASIVAYFGSTLPQYRIAKNYKNIKIIEDTSLPCRGCRHETRSHHVVCATGDDLCMKLISSEMIIAKINEFL